MKFLSILVLYRMLINICLYVLLKTNIISESNIDITMKLGKIIDNLTTLMLQKQFNLIPFN